MTFISAAPKEKIKTDDLYINWHGNNFRIDVLKLIKKITWDNEEIAIVRAKGKNAAFEIAMKLEDYQLRKSALNSMSEQVRKALPKRVLHYS